MASIPISLEDPRCGQIMSTVTDASGAYSFSGLKSGPFLIDAEDAPGFCPTTPNSFRVEVGFGEELEISFATYYSATARQASAGLIPSATSPMGSCKGSAGLSQAILVQRRSGDPHPTGDLRRHG